MNILLCNDDGVYAAGIRCLYEELKEKHNVTIVAPLEERSTTGHTLCLDSPLRLERIEENIYGCSGYPADCALMGLRYVLRDEPVDLVISGINRGANLGQDIYYSGTVAAAREATFRGVKAIAVSLVIEHLSKEHESYNYKMAASFIDKALDQKIYDLIDRNTLININVPDIKESDLKGAEWGGLGYREYEDQVHKRLDFKDRPYYWIGGGLKESDATEGTDCAIVKNNKVSLSKLDLIDKRVLVGDKERGLIDKL